MLWFIIHFTFLHFLVLAPSITYSVILSFPTDQDIIFILCFTKFYMFPQWCLKKKFLVSFLSLFFFLCINVIHLCILLECTCLKVTMLTLSGLNSKGDIISHEKRTGAPGLATSDIQCQDQRLWSFSSFSLAVHRAESELPSQFQDGRGNSNFHAQKDSYTGKKRVFSSLCLHFINEKSFPRSWPWLPNSYSGSFAFLLLRLKFSTQMRM